MKKLESKITSGKSKKIRKAAELGTVIFVCVFTLFFHGSGDGIELVLQSVKVKYTVPLLCVCEYFVWKDRLRNDLYCVGR